MHHPGPAEKMKRERLLGIQFARGIAALLVVMYHSCRMVALPQYAGHEGFGGFFAFSHAGVDFFFVLSGFIIFFVHHTDFGKPQNLPRYAWRRVTRIYPCYWLVLAAVVAMMAAKHDPGLTTGHFLKSLFLIPDTMPPLLIVAWTLVFEMMFYGVFALGIINLRLGIFAAALWLALIVSGVFADSQVQYLNLLSAPRNLQFGIGIVAATVVLRTRVRFPLWFAGVGVLIFLATGMAENAHAVVRDGTVTQLLFGTGSGLVIAGIASAEREGALQVGRIGEFFGGTSYLLYLVHVMVLGFCFRAMEMIGLFPMLPAWLASILAAAGAVVVAGLLFAFFDKPVQSVLQRFGQRHLFSKKQPA